MLSGHKMETTLFCSSLLRIISWPKDFFSCVSGGAVRRKGSKRELHLSTTMYRKTIGISSLSYHWTVIAPGKSQAGQARFHDGYMCSSELSKSGYCEAQPLRYFVERWPWEILQTARPWRVLGHIRSWKVLRKPTGKMTIDFLEWRNLQYSLAVTP